MEALYDEAYRLFSKLVLGDHLREGTSTSLRSQLANIYTMDDKNETLRYSRLSGILTLDIDRKLKTTLFRMYSVHSLELIFECELYYGFEDNYRQISQTLWAFDFLEGIIAIEFTTPKEADDMAFSVRKYSHKLSEYLAILEERKKEDLVKKKEGTFFGKLKNIFNKEDKKETTKIISVKKENSVTFDQTAGKFENIPPQLQQAFTQLGFTKKHLENKETAKVLFEEILMYQTIREASADPEATSLRQTVKMLNLEEKPKEEENESVTGTPSVRQLPLELLPPPPPLGAATQNTPLGPLPQILIAIEKEKGESSIRSDLLKQIQSGSFKLKPVSYEGTKTIVDMSCMDKDERQDMSDYLRMALKKRRKALLRDQDDDEEG